MKVSDLPIAPLCPACHKFLHRTYSNAQLAGELSSVSALLQQPQVQAFVKWVRKQPPSRQVRVR